MYTVGVAASDRYPQGGVDRDGAPLCHEHRLTRCSRCRQLFPQKDLTRHVVGQREDRHLRRGKTPRVEEVFGVFCEACAAVEARRLAPAQRRAYTWAALLVLFIGGLVVLCILLTTGKIR